MAVLDIDYCLLMVILALLLMMLLFDRAAWQYAGQRLEGSVVGTL